MTLLDRLIPAPRLCELDDIELAARPARVYERLRHGDLSGGSPFIRALFAVRELPRRLAGHAEPLTLRIDALRSSPEQPGFQVLLEDAPHELAVGAIGQVWQLEIPFVHVPDAVAYAAFDAPDQVKVAWALRVRPRGEHGSTLEFEVRVDATDDDAWRKFRRYFRLIGPGSHFIRRTLLAGLARELGSADTDESARPLAGDALLPDARAGLTHGITIDATPERIWPWLVQMGCHRAGFYSLDSLDNGGVPSARELHPELSQLAVGDVIPAQPVAEGGFEVLAIDAPRALVLGGLWDTDAGKQLPFASPRPQHYWHVTWAFALEPLDAARTRVHVRARGAFSDGGRLHALLIRPVHHLMQTVQLRNLAARAEGRLPVSSARDVLEGLGGAGLIAVAMLSPFLRGRRVHHGLTEAEARQPRAGDALVPTPRFAWTHAIEIDAASRDVWPWVAQLGADRAGFYSYQWLENLSGCELKNAETVHPEWALREGDGLMLHPRIPPLPVVEVVEGSHLLVYGAPDTNARDHGEPWVGASWLFQLEPLTDARCRLISRFRSDCSDDLPTRLANGPTLLEPIGFAMDRRMLLGIKQRVEQRAHAALSRGATA